MMNPTPFVKTGWCAIGAFWLLLSWRVKPPALEQRTESRLPYMVGIVGAFVLVFDANLPLGRLNHAWLPAERWLLVPGLLLCLAGWALALWARLVIGENWSATVQVKRGHTLTQHGPYARVRHPIYSGLLLALMGTAVIDGHMRAALGFLLACGLLKMKSELEERWMRFTFGPTYDIYYRSTGALFPRLR